MDQRAGQCRGALLRTGIGLRIGPFARARLNGARAVGSAPQMAKAVLGTGLPKHLAAIATAVVGHDPLDRDAVSGKPGQRAFEKAVAFPCAHPGKISL
jgi:hypothetical protein